MSARKKICILGGGIAGLTVAYELSKQHDVVLLEKKKEVGGWIETDDRSPFFFEKGPRTFPTRRSKSLLELALELGLEGELIPADPNVKKRYIRYQGKLQLAPSNPLSLITSPLTKGLLLHLLFKEWRIPVVREDESIWEFARRRLGARSADLLFDPMVKGVFGGDAKALSVEACFPFLKKLEREKGSLIKGVLKGEKKGCRLPLALEKSSLFSFRQGVKTLMNALKDQIEGELSLEESALQLDYVGGGWEVVTNRRRLFADLLISALPSFEIGALFQSIDAPLSAALRSIPYEGLTLVHVGFEKRVLKNEGFGYLVPSCEDQRVLGVIFDSSIFPQHNRRPLETRLTMIFPKGGENMEALALRTLQDHLHIHETPPFLQISTASRSIPQYRLGHREIVEDIELRMQELFPSCFLVGSYLKGVSVSDCIEQARLTAKIAEQLGKEEAYPLPETRRVAAVKSH